MKLVGRQSTAAQIVYSGAEPFGDRPSKEGNILLGQQAPNNCHTIFVQRGNDAGWINRRSRSETAFWNIVPLNPHAVSDHV